MTIEAKIIADSINPKGERLTTFVLKYPRFIHSELMTHRVLSRNASSSRAIPVKKIIQQVIDEPAIPIKWIANQPGMQGYNEIENPEAAREVWLRASYNMIDAAKELIDLNVHKSLANRLLEPWHHITVIVSATSLANFFALRYHAMAEDNFQELAKQMAISYERSTPAVLQWGDWHLPFVTYQDRRNYDDETNVKISTARCARVSYLTHEKEDPTLEADISLHDKLVVQQPLHASPAEHPAHACRNLNCDHGNYRGGWHQYRKMLPNENVESFMIGDRQRV